MKCIRIGAGTGYWGNGAASAIEMAKKGNIQYLCCDGLAELTLAILRKGMNKGAYKGFVPELTALVKGLLPIIKEKGIKFISNHGALNPLEAMYEIQRVAEEMGITGIKVAVVLGDDQFEKLAELEACGNDLTDMDTGKCFDEIRDKNILFANVYTGAKGMVDALENGADIVIAGRVADSACFLAPMVYELGWSWEDWDKLAAGTLAGHLLECSSQSTGGNFLGNWQAIPRMEEIGYPIAEVYENGDVIITKPEGSGGLVNVETISEQLVYETLDPNNYIVPDVIADFTTPHLEDLGNDRVLITGMKGKPRPEKLKLFMGYEGGWASSKMLVFSWPDALQKAEKMGDILKHQMDAKHLKYDEFRKEYLGLNSVFGSTAKIPDEDEINEVAVKYTIKTDDKKVAGAFARIVMSMGLDGPPANAGLAGFAGGPRELLNCWSTLINREDVEKGITVQYCEL